jgi:preprotein translocase subunit SecD
MKRSYIYLILIVVLMAIVIWIDVSQSFAVGSFQRNLKPVLGLDLKGGLQVLLEADLPADTAVDSQSLTDANKILESRANALGVSEVVFQTAGNRRIVGEFPGLSNTEEVLATLKGTGLLEFVDMGDQPLPEGAVIKTDYRDSKTNSQSSQNTPASTSEATSSTSATEPTSPATSEKVYHTVMTGGDLSQVGVSTSTLGSPVVNFELKSEGAQVFKEFTSNNVGKYLAIVLDNKVISAPRINSAITQGQGMIEGNFTVDSANNLAVQLRYGSLPIPLKIAESRLIGPTLGQDSLRQSILAAAIGFTLVILFMLIYYRLPGLVGILAIICYAAITFAIFKIIPVTLTLPGIAGFLLSTGAALDANILIFERFREETRNGRNTSQGVDIAWKRAWPSIRDSNIATVLTSIVLFWFGSAYGATIVKGFALTLALGVVVSLFSAAFITRTFLGVAFGFINTKDHTKWIGV